MEESNANHMPVVAGVLELEEENNMVIANNQRTMHPPQQQQQPQQQYQQTYAVMEEGIGGGGTLSGGDDNGSHMTNSTSGSNILSSVLESFLRKRNQSRVVASAISKSSSRSRYKMPGPRQMMANNNRLRDSTTTTTTKDPRRRNAEMMEQQQRHLQQQQQLLQQQQQHQHQQQELQEQEAESAKQAMMEMEEDPEMAEIKARSERFLAMVRGGGLGSNNANSNVGSSTPLQTSQDHSQSKVDFSSPATTSNPSPATTSEISPTKSDFSPSTTSNSVFPIINPKVSPTHVDPPPLTSTNGDVLQKSAASSYSSLSNVSHRYPISNASSRNSLSNVESGHEPHRRLRSARSLVSGGTPNEAVEAFENEEPSSRTEMRSNYASAILSDESDGLEVEATEHAHGQERKASIYESHAVYCIVVAIVFIVAAVVVAVVASVSSSDSASTRVSLPPTEAPTMAPTFSERANELLTFLRNVSLDEGRALANVSSPQHQAFLWWVDNTADTGYTRSTNLRRYALATWYYSTHGDDWLSRQNWLSLVGQCEWEFLLCYGSSTAVSQMSMAGNNMVGTIPPELTFLDRRLSKGTTPTSLFPERECALTPFLFSP